MVDGGRCGRGVGHGGWSGYDDLGGHDNLVGVQQSGHAGVNSGYPSDMPAEFGIDGRDCHGRRSWGHGDCRERRRRHEPRGVSLGESECSFVELVGSWHAKLVVSLLLRGRPFDGYAGMGSQGSYRRPF